MPSTELIIDESAPLSFLADGRSSSPTPADRSWMAFSWVDDVNRRRLERYKLLDALIHNVSRAYHHRATDAERKERREYGDAALLVEAALNSLFGEDVSIAVADAESSEQAKTRQGELEAWATDEGLVEKMFEAEWDAIGLGDTVYTLGWSNRKQRVRLRVYNPGFYFPVLGDNDDDDYPTRVHLGWEFDETLPDGTEVTKVRRITWDLAGEDVPGGGPECLLSEGTWTFDALSDRHQDDFDPAQATWATNEDGETVFELGLGIDFIPVVHVPNTPASQSHFGKSLLLFVLQLLWDIHGADTDREMAAKLIGTPMLGVDATPPPSSVTPSTPSDVSMWGNSERGLVSGLNGYPADDGPTIEVRPGAVIFGKATVLDLSAGVAALDKHAEELRALLSVNAQIPGEVLGRVIQTEMSGIRFALAFGPLGRLVRKMRLVRRRKYPLLLKFVQRITIAVGPGYEGGTADALPAEVVFGAFLPTDRAAVIAEVTDLVRDKLITPQTGLQRLVDEGIVDLDDVAAEIRVIEAADAEAARRMIDRLGNDDPNADDQGSQFGDDTIQP